MAFKKAGCPVLGMEKTRRKPGLGSRGESLTDGGAGESSSSDWEEELKLMEYDV